MSDEPTILNRARHALGRFLQLEASAGILLIGAALVALAWANSPLAATYDGIRGVPVSGLDDQGPATLCGSCRALARLRRRRHCW